VQSSPFPGARHPSNEVRLSPDGRVAQRLPDEMVTGDRCWVCWAWPNFQLEVIALTDMDVADWRLLHREEVR